MADSDLTTVENVKAVLGLTVSTADGGLARLVAAVSQAFRTYLNRDLSLTTYTETRDGTGTAALLLANRPVLSVTSVQVGPPSLPRQAYVVNRDYVVTNTAIRHLWGTWPLGIANIVVTYTAGYEAIPFDIEAAATKVTAQRYKEFDRLGQVSKILGGETVMFDMKAFPADVKLTLDQYRNVLPI